MEDDNAASAFSESAAASNPPNELTNFTSTLDRLLEEQQQEVFVSNNTLDQIS